MGPEDNIGISELLEQAKNSISEFEPEFKGFVFAERFDFYNRVSKAFAVVITGQEDGNFILKKVL